MFFGYLSHNIFIIFLNTIILTECFLPSLYPEILTQSKSISGILNSSISTKLNDLNNSF
jgi:hypothetical protein